jgi:hypothetical protein
VIYYDDIIASSGNSYNRWEVNNQELTNATCVQLMAEHVLGGMAKGI